MWGWHPSPSTQPRGRSSPGSASGTRAARSATAHRRAAGTCEEPPHRRSNAHERTSVATPGRIGCRSATDPIRCHRNGPVGGPRRALTRARQPRPGAATARSRVPPAAGPAAPPSRSARRESKRPRRAGRRPPSSRAARPRGGRRREGREQPGQRMGRLPQPRRISPIDRVADPRQGAGGVGPEDSDHLALRGSSARRSDTPTRARRGAQRSSRHRSTSGLGGASSTGGPSLKPTVFLFMALSSVANRFPRVLRRSSIKRPFSLPRLSLSDFISKNPLRRVSLLRRRGG